MTTKHEVLALHREHPDWTGPQIAEKLDCTPEYVTATFRRNGLKLPNSDRKCYVSRRLNALARRAAEEVQP